MTACAPSGECPLERIKPFGAKYHTYIMEPSSKKLEDGLLFVEKGHLLVSNKGEFLVMGLLADTIFRLILS